MAKQEHIQSILQRIFYQLTAKFSIAATFLQILLMLLIVIKRYAIPDYEPYRFPLVYTIISRIVGFCAFLLLYFLTKYCRTKGLIVFTYMVMPIITFEANAFFSSYVESYLIFALFSSATREFALINLTQKSVFILESLTVIYHVIRSIIFKMTVPDFSLLAFVNYLIAYVLLNFPVLEYYTKIHSTILEYESFRIDFEAIITSLPIPIFKFSLLPAQITTYNEDFGQLLHSIGISEPSVFLSNMLRDTTLLQLINSGKVEDQLVYNCNSVEYSIKFRQVISYEHNFIVACIQDMTSIKQIEALKAKESYKAMFLSVISHQLRTPINGILFPLNSLKELDNLSNESRVLLDIATSSLEVMSSLIESSIAFSDCAQGKMKMEWGECNLPMELNKLKKLFQIESEQKKIDFKVDVLIAQQIIIVDIKKVMQILIILLSNAFKYTLKGSVALSCKSSEDQILVNVSDTGIGIDQESIPNIFNEFNSPDQVNSQKITSGCFQLALVKKLVSIMEGSIQVRSEKNVGTQFILTFKIKKAVSENTKDNSLSIKQTSTSNPLRARNSSNESLASDKRKKPINKVIQTLIVDDNATNVLVLEKMLGILNIKTDKAMNGLECLNKVCERGMNGYDLILMDINMPVMNGFETAEAILKLVSEKKVAESMIVIVTAQSEASVIGECKKLGINKCLFKPIKLTDLKDIISDINYRKYKI